MFNQKQIELSRMLFEKVKSQFPEVRLVDISEAANNPTSIWVNILMPADEERQIALTELASEVSMDILEGYGYHITISTASAPEESAA